MNIVILGAGESGVGAALLSKQKGYPTFVSDRGSIAPAFKQQLEQQDIPYEENKHTRERIFEATEIIKSPGIPDTVELVQQARSKGIPVISEIEFAARHTTASLIAITGSNGKTTTTNLTYHLLHTAGFNVGVGGNIGQSFARLVANHQRDYYVLELSSFQLDGIQDFKPQIAMLLNVTPDHLDRYDNDFRKYLASKFRIIQNQTAEDLLIYNASDDSVRGQIEAQGLIPRGAAVHVPESGLKGLTVQGMSFDLSKCSLKGPHNLFNAHCAIRAALEWGASAEAIQKGLDSFVNIPHRLESVATVDGVEYINDSKATNVDAVYYALQAMDPGVVWIAGGKDKGNDYGPLLELVNKKVKAIVCMGIDNQKIRDAFSPIVADISETRSAEAAVQQAAAKATRGEVVLLSPACASFDLFNNYEDRGDQFKAAVKQLHIDSKKIH
ncbi:MAG: UDP-N-acetylmuramoyl-L-alanine--D-glutamate ligase [Bacteroidota bacterium]